MVHGYDDLQKIKERLYEEARQTYNEYNRGQLNRLEGFDPLIDMLLSACASEFKVSWSEIRNSWARMLESTARLMTPEVHTGAYPTHGIAHARALVPEVDTQFDKDQIVYTTRDDKSIYFSPSGNFKLWDGRIKFMAFGDALFHFESPIQKTEILKTKQRKQISPYTIWFGLESNLNKLPKQLSFFFDWPAKNIQDQSEELLIASKWKLNGKPIPIEIGLPQQDHFNTGFDEFHLIRKIENEINLIYQNQFLTLSLEQHTATSREFFPNELESFFTEEDLMANIDSNCWWIKVEFPELFFNDIRRTADLFKKSIIQINCFPILNRKLDDPSYNLTDTLNLFPLRHEGYFLSIEDVLSSKLKKQYTERPFVDLFKSNTDLNHQGIRSERLPDRDMENRNFVLRKAGVNRFDTRDAQELIVNLIRYIREETFVFSALGKNILSNNIKIIRKNLNDIETRIKFGEGNGADKEKTVFIGFPGSQRETVIVRYWSTIGHLANNIPSGIALTLESGAAWDRDSLVLVKKTTGGRDPLPEMEKVHEFKSALIVRDKIVTKEDIRLFCFEKLGDHLQNVLIQQGADIAYDSDKGMIRTLEVHLTFGAAFNEDEDYKVAVLRNLETQLNKQSSIILPIRLYASN